MEEFQSSSSAAVFPSAHLQSAHVALSTQKTIDSTSFVDAGYTLAITPTATDSVMRIRFMVPTNPGINYAYVPLLLGLSCPFVSFFSTGSTTLSLF